MVTVGQPGQLDLSRHTERYCRGCIDANAVTIDDVVHRYEPIEQMIRFLLGLSGCHLPERSLRPAPASAWACERGAIGGQNPIIHECTQHSFAPALLDTEQTRCLPHGQRETGHFAELALNADV
jgi:hypothetical protein